MDEPIRRGSDSEYPHVRLRDRHRRRPSTRRCALSQLRSHNEIHAVTAVHPRPDFKNEILQAFTDGFQQRPDTTFGTVNADVLEHFVPNFHRVDFVDVIKNSAWPE